MRVLSQVAVLFFVWFAIVMFSRSEEGHLDVIGAGVEHA